MLSELRFVQGSVSKKDFVPALTHFVIENNTVRGYNGTIALCSPIPFDIKCKPKAEPLIRAIANCTDTVTLALTPAGRLSVKSGKFKAFVECSPEETTAHAVPEGDVVALDGAALLAGLKAVQPFIGDDATRPWTNGVLLKGESAFATNNVSVIEYWTGSKFPITVNLPRAAVKEMVRIDEAPISAQVHANSISFHYSGGQWIRSQLLPSDWPDLSCILDRDSTQRPVDPALFEALMTVRPFLDKTGRVFFIGGTLCTHVEPDQGASVELEGFDTIDGVYNLEILRLLEGTAATIDWSMYPSPCVFQGERLRGALVGMKK